MDHLDIRPEYAKVERSFTVDDHGKHVGTLKVTSIEKDVTGAKTKVEYTVTLDYIPDPQVSQPPKLVVSLYTICVQGRRFEVTIKDAQGSDVRFYNPKGFSPGWQTWNQKPVDLIEAAPPPSGSGHGSNPAEENRVALVEFTGVKCVLEIVSKRMLHRRQYPTTHDVTPPPGEGGGQDGDN